MVRTTGGPFGAAHPLDRFRNGQVFGESLINPQNLVTGLDADTLGRRIFNGRDNRENPILDADLNAKTTESPLGIDLHLPEGLRAHEGTVGIKRRKHAVDGAVDQLLRIHLFNVAFLDDHHHIGQKPDVLILLPPWASQRRWVLIPIKETSTTTMINNPVTILRVLPDFSIVKYPPV